MPRLGVAVRKRTTLLREGEKGHEKERALERIEGMRNREEFKKESEMI